MDVGKYLTRIGFEDDVQPTLACLTKLQNLHQLHVPWENLDVFTNRRKQLVVEELYEQIVVQHRGGWCHEINGLFAWLLRSLGFEAGWSTSMSRSVPGSCLCQVSNATVNLLGHPAPPTRGPARS